MHYTRRSFVLLRQRSAALEIRTEDDLRKDPSIARVTTRQALGFRRQAMGPLEAHFAHPFGCPTFFPSQEVDRRADAECAFRCDFSAVLMNPEFLFGSTDTDNQQVRRCRSDLGEDLFVLRG